MPKVKRSLRKTDFVGTKEVVCPAHEFLINKLIEIEKRQIQYMGESAETNRIVKNGLQKKMEDIARAVTEYHTEMNIKIAPLDNFKWCIDAVTKMRNNLLIYSIKGVFVAVIILILAHLTDKTISALIVKAFGG
jgi:hypothetical protein